MGTNIPKRRVSSASKAQDQLSNRALNALTFHTIAHAYRSQPSWNLLSLAERNKKRKAKKVRASSSLYKPEALNITMKRLL